MRESKKHCELTSVTVSVPGKVMLAGEYAVLKGGPALAHTVSCEMTVRIEPSRGRGETVVRSSSWPESRSISARDISGYATGKDHEDRVPLIEVVKRASHSYDNLPDLVQVDSQIDVRHGMGSSSALRLGVATGIAVASGRADSVSAALLAFESQVEGQSRASGYDIVTQLKGGLVLFQPEYPGRLSRADVEAAKSVATGTEWQEQITFFVGGKGAPTGPVALDTVAWIEQRGLWDAVRKTQSDLVDTLRLWSLSPGDHDLRRKACQAVGASRRLMQNAPHQPEWLSKVGEGLVGLDTEYSFKTTGAGGEDAILVIGDLRDARPLTERLTSAGWYAANVRLSNQPTRWVVS